MDPGRKILVMNINVNNLKKPDAFPNESGTKGLYKVLLC